MHVTGRLLVALPRAQLVWCGANDIVLLWGRSLVMVGPEGAALQCESATPPLLYPEVRARTAALPPKSTSVA